MNPKNNIPRIHPTNLKFVKPLPLEVNPTAPSMIGSTSKSRPLQTSTSSSNIEGLLSIINEYKAENQYLKQQIKQIELEVNLFLINFSQSNSQIEMSLLNKEEYTCCSSYSASDIINTIKSQFQICISTILSNFRPQDEEKPQIKSYRKYIVMQAEDFVLHASKLNEIQKVKVFNVDSEEIINESEFKESISIATDFIIEKLNFCMSENVFSIENEEKFLRDLEQIKEKMLYSFEGNSPKDSVKTISQIENA